MQDNFSCDSEVEAFIEGFFEASGKPTNTPTTKGNPKKRRKEVSPMESALDLNRVANRLDRLEITIEKLCNVMQSILTDKYSGKQNTDQETTHTDQPISTDPAMNLLQITKNVKDEFYRLYGSLKNSKNQFTREQLNNRFEDRRIDIFRDRRAKFTTWMKLGFALSRQIEEAQKPLKDDHYPLLTIKSMAIKYGEEHSEYLKLIEKLRSNLQEKLILEAHGCLQNLNTQIKEILDGSTEQEEKHLTAKAFKAAIFSSSYLFKKRPLLHTDFIESTVGFESDAVQDNTRPNTDYPPLERPLYSQMTRPIYSQTLQRQTYSPRTSNYGPQSLTFNKYNRSTEIRSGNGGHRTGLLRLGLSKVQNNTNQQQFQSPRQSTTEIYLQTSGDVTRLAPTPGESTQCVTTPSLQSTLPTVGLASTHASSLPPPKSDIAKLSVQVAQTAANPVASGTGHGSSMDNG